jgi:hypothetical protein
MALLHDHTRVMDFGPIIIGIIKREIPFQSPKDLLHLLFGNLSIPRQILNFDPCHLITLPFLLINQSNFIIKFIGECRSEN